MILSNLAVSGDYIMTVKLLSKQQLSLTNKDTLRYRLAEAEKDYFLTLILNYIYNSHLKDKLIFKGGTAFYHCYLPQLRFSEDLDFTSIAKDIKIGTEIMSDEYLPYQSLNKEGYKHKTISHGQNEYARGNIHVNSLEGFWSQLKRSINGTYHCVSPKYLQSYVNEFSYRYNNRFSSEPLFDLMLSQILK